MRLFFRDPEPRIISILYGWSGIWWRFGLFSYMFSLVTSSNLMVFVLCYYIIILLHLISSSLHTTSLLVSYVSVSIESIDCILLSSLVVNFFSRYIMFRGSESLLWFWYELFVFYELFMIFSRTSTLFFFSRFISFSSRIAP